MLSKIKNLFGKKNELDDVEQNSQSLSLEPESESPKKVNNLVIGSIVAALSGVLIFAVMSGGDDATVKTNADKDSGSVSTASLTSDKLKNLDKAKSTNPSDQKQMDSHEHSNEEVLDDHDHDHNHEHGDVHATSNMNPNATVATNQPQPIVLSDEEKEAKEDAKEARNEYKTRVKTRAKEDLDGSRSPIFFTLKQEKKESPTESNTTVENANDYYNNHSKDNYISVLK